MYDRRTVTRGAAALALLWALSATSPSLAKPPGSRALEPGLRQGAVPLDSQQAKFCKDIRRLAAVAPATFTPLMHPTKAEQLVRLPSWAESCIHSDGVELICKVNPPERGGLVLTSALLTRCLDSARIVSPSAVETPTARISHTASDIDITGPFFEHGGDLESATAVVRSLGQPSRWAEGFKLASLPAFVPDVAQALRSEFFLPLTRTPNAAFQYDVSSYGAGAMVRVSNSENEVVCSVLLYYGDGQWRIFDIQMESAGQVSFWRQELGLKLGQNDLN